VCYAFVYLQIATQAGLSGQAHIFWCIATLSDFPLADLLMTHNTMEASTLFHMKSLYIV